MGGGGARGWWWWGVFQHRRKGGGLQSARPGLWPPTLEVRRRGTTCRFLERLSWPGQSRIAWPAMSMAEHEGSAKGPAEDQSAHPGSRPSALGSGWAETSLVTVSSPTAVAPEPAVTAAQETSHYWTDGLEQST